MIYVDTQREFWAAYQAAPPYDLVIFDDLTPDHKVDHDV